MTEHNGLPVGHGTAASPPPTHPEEQGDDELRCLQHAHTEVVRVCGTKEGMRYSSTVVKGLVSDIRFEFRHKIKSAGPFCSCDSSLCNSRPSLACVCPSALGWFLPAMQADTLGCLSNAQERGCRPTGPSLPVPPLPSLVQLGLPLPPTALPQALLASLNPAAVAHRSRNEHC